MASEMEYCASDAGLHAKSDCVASYIPGPGPLEVVVKSSVESLFGSAIKAAALRIALDFGVKSGCIEVDDDGALGETVAARIEAALWKAGFSCRKRKESAIPVPLVRGPSSRQRSRRTRLYLPGNQPHFFINADLFGADCLLFDLEDSVVPERKVDARILVRNTLCGNKMLGACEIMVRINPLSGPFGYDDLAEIVPAIPHVIVLPKCESAQDIKQADEEIGRLEESAGIPRGSIFLVPLVETARGILAADRIASASRRNVAICFGKEDFIRDIHAVPDPEGNVPKGTESLMAREMIVLAAHASGIDALDSVFSDIEDEAGLAASCREARALGFSGRAILHPLQVPVANAAFRPTEEEYRDALEVVEAYEQASDTGKGSLSVRGRMIDAPVVERARAAIREYTGEP